MSLVESMGALEAAGSAQTRKTWLRHGCPEPMFGVSFAALKTLMKRIGVDHELAHALWDTGNYDARNLAVKVVDPARMAPADLDRWAVEQADAPMSGAYVAMIAAEGPYGVEKAEQWLGSASVRERCVGWAVLGQLAQLDEALPDTYFETRLAQIERTIRSVANAERGNMNATLIQIGLRNPALRAAALAGAARIGPVHVDHGDTECKTPDAAASMEKAWAHSLGKGFASPAAHERGREVLRRRC
ncbi:MAG: DNA alkylation repair protein [Pseudomonadota bacterium]|nr:DNA alkylation repair protein [Pseudomonadota bacterium]